MVGTPHTDNYTLGRGEILLAPFISAQLQNVEGFRYVGNSPDFAFGITTTKLEHFDSDHGAKTKDASIVLDVNRTGSFSTDDMSLENLAVFLSGVKTTTLGLTLPTMPETHIAVPADRIIVLGVSAGAPDGLRNISAITAVTGPAGTPVYVAGVDFTVDLTKGQITMLASSPTFVGGTNVLVTYTAGATLNTQRVISGNTFFEGAMRYNAFNAAGLQVDYFFPSVRITPDGDYAVKGDTWQTIKFAVDILDPSDGVRAAVYVEGRPYVTGSLPT